MQTIRTLAVAFGPVEHFGPFVPESDGVYIALIASLLSDPNLLDQNELRVIPIASALNLRRMMRLDHPGWTAAYGKSNGSIETTALAL